jgi:FixJ family two-component response regulator
MDGIELLQRIKEESPDTEVIMITGHGEMELAIRSLKHEATDFITKTAAEIVPPTVRAGLQGEALTFSNTVRDLTILMLLAARHVRSWLHSKLSPSFDRVLGLLTALVGGC